MNEKLTGRYRFRSDSIGSILKQKVVVLQVQCTGEIMRNLGPEIDFQEHTYWRDGQIEDILELGLTGSVK